MSTHRPCPWHLAGSMATRGNVFHPPQFLLPSDVVYLSRRHVGHLADHPSVRRAPDVDVAGPLNSVANAQVGLPHHRRSSPWTAGIDSLTVFGTQRSMCPAHPLP